jgi:hypothetical protein
LSGVANGRRIHAIDSDPRQPELAEPGIAPDSARTVGFSKALAFMITTGI